MKTEKVRWRFPEREGDFGTHIKFLDMETLCGKHCTGNGVGSIVTDEDTWQNFIESEERVSCMKCQMIVNFCKDISDIEIPKFNVTGRDYETDFESGEAEDCRL